MGRFKFHTEPLELLRLQPSEPIASESVLLGKSVKTIPLVHVHPHLPDLSCINDLKVRSRFRFQQEHLGRASLLPFTKLIRQLRDNKTLDFFHVNLPGNPCLSKFNDT